MKPIPFKQQNTIYAKDQDEYLPLPASFTERMKVFLFGRIFVSVWTFNYHLQPQRLSVDFEELD